MDDRVAISRSLTDLREESRLVLAVGVVQLLHPDIAEP